MSTKFNSLEDLKKSVLKKDETVSIHKVICGLNKNHKSEIFDEHFSASGLQRFMLKVKKYKEFKECTTVSEQYAFLLIAELKPNNTDLQFKILFQYGTEKQLKFKDGTAKKHFSLFLFAGCLKKHMAAKVDKTDAQKLAETKPAAKEDKTDVKSIVSKARSKKALLTVISDNSAQFKGIETEKPNFTELKKTMLAAC